MHYWLFPLFLYSRRWNTKRHRGTSQFEIPLSVWVPLCQTNRLIGLFKTNIEKKELR